ncbi:mCG144576, partial [Mus musculus]
RLHHQHFHPQRTRQHTGKLPKEGTPASQELTTFLPSYPPLGAPLPPSSCSQQAGPGTRSHAAVLLPGELGGRSELCREKARPVRVSEMNHRHPCAAGLHVSQGSCSVPENGEAQRGSRAHSLFISRGFLTVLPLPGMGSPLPLSLPPMIHSWVPVVRTAHPLLHSPPKP